MQRPMMTETCDSCTHTFGQHYGSYDGTKDGCTYCYDNQRDGGPCGCRGFAIIYRYPPPGSQAEAYDNQ